MAEITLADYAGYLLLQMVRAREMADAYSRSVAERYAQDPVLRHLPSPRFKAPKIELTIPVLISAAKFTQLVRFDVAEEEFVAAMASRADDVRTSVELARGGRLLDRVMPGGSSRPTIEQLARRFHKELAANHDPLRPEGIGRTWRTQIFRTSLAQADLLGFYEESDPSHDLLRRSTSEVLDLVRARTVVDRTTIDTLLVDPETNVVKNGSSPTTVFTIKAELLEEGFFLRSLREEGTGQVTTVVEFE